MYGITYGLGFRVWSLNSLKGGIYRVIQRTIIGDIKGDTESVDPKS